MTRGKKFHRVVGIHQTFFFFAAKASHFGKMWAFKLVYLLLLASVSVKTEEEWSWGSAKQKTEEKPKSDTTAEGSVNPKVVDEIITSERDGRMLTGYSDIYEDQDVQDAVSSGNETHARSLVRERLCGLGLMAVSTYTT